MTDPPAGPPQQAASTAWPAVAEPSVPTAIVESIGRVSVHRVLDAAREQAVGRGVAADAFAGDGDAADVLVGLAEHHAVDVLVIGNKGADRRILGSVPKSVVQHAPCDVYVVKTT